MENKKNGLDVLNAVKAAYKIIGETIEKSQAEISALETQVLPSASKAKTTVELLTATKEEPPTAVISVIQPAPQENPYSEQEAVQGLSILLPKSIYKRLSKMKIDANSESLKSLGLKAIIEYLNKNGY